MSEPLTGQLKDAVRAIAALRGKVERLEAERNAPIAVVGLACRFPGAADSAAFWELMAERRDAVRPVPPDRWDAAAWHDASVEVRGRIAYSAAACLDSVDTFDAALFGIADREAAGMDPQHRLFLEVAWHALEDALIAPDRLQGAPVGVFLGLNGADHLALTLADPARLDAHALSGGVASVAAGRLAFHLGLTGPSLVIDTACSSSLVSAHLAVQSLRRGECDVALAAGVHLLLAPQVPVALSRARMLAPDGRCKPFDARADGFGQGEGCGVVVLKRLADAVAAGDLIRAVIRGSALNQDGRSAGLTAPSGPAQAAVIRAALENAGLPADAVDAIEAHGTGTALGDPVELRALAAVFKAHDRPLWVGSVKGNIGHLAAAAGIAGLIKACLMVERGQVLPSAGFTHLNPHAELDGVDIRVPVQPPPSRPRAVGVSSFGFSGTNAHLIVTPASDRAALPARPSAGDDPPLVLAARTGAALRRLAAAYQQALARDPASFAAMCRSAAVGRARLPVWLAAKTPDELAHWQKGKGPVPELRSEPGPRTRLPLYPFEPQRFAPRRDRLAAPPPRRLGRPIASPLAERQFEALLDLDRQPWLADHVVAGRVVVPGAFHLVLMAEALPAGCSTLADIAFPEPALLEPGMPLRLVAVAAPDGAVTVSSLSGEGWVVHARGQATAEPAVIAAIQPPPPTAALSLRAAWQQRLARRGIRIGPAFQAITALVHGEGRAAARLEMPEEVIGDGLPLHPALLDAALQVAGGTIEGEATLLPVGIDRFTLPGPARGELRASATRAGAGIDVQLEAGGRPLAVIQGLRVRAVGEAAAGISLATIAWLEAGASDGAGPREAARRTLHVAAAEGGLHTLLAALRQLAEAGEAGPTDIIIARPDAAPTCGAAVGLVNAITAELPELKLGCMEVDAAAIEALPAARDRRPAGEPWLRLTAGGTWLRPRLTPLPPGPSEPPPALHGTVLVSGGHGGLGRQLAAWAVARGAEAVLLVGRRSGELPELAVPVRGLALDIAAGHAVEAIDAALAALPPLGGIVHAAGLRGDALLPELTAAQLDAALAPKLAGALQLHALSLRHAPRQFLLMGSLASFAGAAGQGAYAAANAALASFAEWRLAQGLPVKLIEWGWWAGAGMAAGLDEAQQARVAARGLRPMCEADALRALDQALGRPEWRLVIAAFDAVALAQSHPPPIFEELCRGIRPTAEAEPLDEVARIVARVLGRPAVAGRPLTSFGLDSLMAVDLRNRLNRNFGSGLQLADLLSGIDIDELTQRVASPPMRAGAELEVVRL